MSSVQVVRATAVRNDDIVRLLGDNALPVEHVEAPSLLVDGRYHTAACRWLRRKHLLRPVPATTVSHARRLAGWIAYLRSERGLNHPDEFAADVFAATSDEMTYPLVAELAAEGVPVALSCEVLGFSRQAFYAWQQKPVSQRDLDDAYLVNAIIDIHGDDPEFGYRLLADELERRGYDVGENRVQRLCAEHKIFSSTTRKGRKNGG